MTSPDDLRQALNSWLSTAVSASKSPQYHHALNAVFGHEEQQDEPELYVGLELLGYRSWNAAWKDGKPVLRPIHRARMIHWTPGVNTAHCFVNGVEPTEEPRLMGEHTPGFGCSCGFWAYNQPLGNDIDANLTLNPYASTMVTGVIRATGTIQLASRGFRAQKAEIVALSPPQRVMGVMRASGALDPNMTKQWNFYRDQIHHYGTCPCVWCREKRHDPPQPTLKQLSDQYDVPYYSTYTGMHTQFPPTRNNTISEVHQRTKGLPWVRGVVTVSAGQPVCHRVPGFGGSSGEVVQKWWRWNLTGSTQDEKSAV